MMNSPEMKQLRETVGQQEHDRAILKAQQEFGDRFNPEQDVPGLVDIQKQIPGAGISDAFMLKDYKRLLEDNVKLKGGVVERKRTQVPPVGGAARLVEEDSGSVDVPKSITTEQADWARKYFGNNKEALQKYHNGLTRQRNGGEIG